MIDTNKDSLKAWEENAKFWDDYMGDESNFFHNDIVRPYTEEFLQIKEGDFVLDIACGNGNFSERLVKIGAEVVAFDYSKEMIKLAKKRREKYIDKIDFNVCDGTNYEELIGLKRKREFNKAVSNMAIMDMAHIENLFKAVSAMIERNGIFVFSMHHPAFTYPNDNYLKKDIYKGIAVDGQPSLQYYYHRPIEEIFNIGFKYGFIISGFKEIPFEGENKPIIMIVKLKKI